MTFYFIVGGNHGPHSERKTIAHFHDVFHADILNLHFLYKIVFVIRTCNNSSNSKQSLSLSLSLSLSRSLLVFFPTLFTTLSETITISSATVRLLSANSFKFDKSKAFVCRLVKSERYNLSRLQRNEDLSHNLKTKPL